MEWIDRCILATNQHAEVDRGSYPAIPDSIRRKTSAVRNVYSVLHFGGVQGSHVALSQHLLSFRGWRVVGITAVWKDLVNHYVLSKRFVADVVCILPFELPCFLFSDICEESLIALLRGHRLVKVYKVHAPL